MGNGHTGEFGKHHVEPEIEKVQQQTETDDDSKNQHILACPLHFLGLVGDSITLTATGTTILCGKDKRINDVTNCQSCQTDSCRHSIPVGPEQCTNHVISLFGEEGYNVHTTVECQK